MPMAIDGDTPPEDVAAAVMVEASQQELLTSHTKQAAYEAAKARRVARQAEQEVKLAKRAEVSRQTEELRTAAAAAEKNKEYMQKVRVTWALLGQDCQRTEQALGLKPGFLEVWKERRAPDGVAWEEFAERHGLTSADSLFEVLGPQDEYAFAVRVTRAAQKLMGSAMLVLDEGSLYDQNGQQVRELFTYDKQRVQIGGLRPRNFAEATSGMKALSGILKEQFESLRNLADMEAAHDRERMDMVKQFGQLVQRQLGVGAWEKILAGAGADGLLGEAKPQEGGAGPEVLEMTVEATAEEEGDDGQEEPGEDAADE